MAYLKSLSDTFQSVLSQESEHDPIIFDPIQDQIHQKKTKKTLARTLLNPVKFLTSDFQTHKFLLIISLYFFVYFYTVTKEAAKTLICYRGICYYYKWKTGEGNHDSSKEVRNVLLASINDTEETECFLTS